MNGVSVMYLVLKQRSRGYRDEDLFSPSAEDRGALPEGSDVVKEAGVHSRWRYAPA